MFYSLSCISIGGLSNSSFDKPEKIMTINLSFCISISPVYKYNGNNKYCVVVMSNSSTYYISPDTRLELLNFIARLDKHY